MDEKTPPERQIYLLSPRDLSPETIAVAFAKTSRSPESFRQIASELTDEKSARFHEKWVVGYGHASVAEHAVLHIAIENVSRLAIESIESNRLASYTEKSTRYQKWDANAFYTPPELENHPLQSLYQSTIRNLLDTYSRSLAAVREVAKAHNPPRAGEDEAAWDRRIRSQYVDVCRFLLPAAALANVGMTANARVLEHSLRKLLSSPLAEVRAIGIEIKQVALNEIPTLVKYAERAPYLEVTPQDLACQPVGVEKPGGDWCRLVAWNLQGEEHVLAAALYRYRQQDFAACLAYVINLDTQGRRELAALLLGRMQPFDIPLRELEHTAYTFDVSMDQGAYFEVKRHRMMTQTPQDLTANLGYATPRWFSEAGFENEYRTALDGAGEAYHRLAAWNSAVASYVVPNGYRRRVLLNFNLREAYHFCSLRSTSRAHFSARRVALRIAEEIASCHPLLAAFMQLPPGETWQAIESAHFLEA